MMFQSGDDDYKSISTVMSNRMHMLNETKLFKNRVEMNRVWIVYIIQIKVDNTEDDHRAGECGRAFENVRKFSKNTDDTSSEPGRYMVIAILHFSVQHGCMDVW